MYQATIDTGIEQTPQKQMRFKKCEHPLSPEGYRLRQKPVEGRRL